MNPGTYERDSVVPLGSSGNAAHSHPCDASQVSAMTQNHTIPTTCNGSKTTAGGSLEKHANGSILPGCIPFDAPKFIVKRIQKAKKKGS